jgi:hypothetical protein
MQLLTADNQYYMPSKKELFKNCRFNDCHSWLTFFENRARNISDYQKNDVSKTENAESLYLSAS